VTIIEAYLFVAARIPKGMAHASDINRVINIRNTVARVYSGRFLISG
jgi:hypothetical protein